MGGSMLMNLYFAKFRKPSHSSCPSIR